MIRRANAGDIAEVARLARLVANDLRRLGIDQWSDIYPLAIHFQADVEKNGLYVYVDHDRVIGAMAILPENDPPYLTIPFSQGKSLVVHRVMVHPNYMKSGIGKQMFQFLIQKAKEEAIDWIKIDTHPDNYRMRSFLQAHAFRQIGYMPSIHRIGYERRP
jgi:GNAT superfamily N-acetyltransferase